MAYNMFSINTHWIDKHRDLDRTQEQISVTDQLDTKNFRDGHHWKSEIPNYVTD